MFSCILYFFIGIIDSLSSVNVILNINVSHKIGITYQNLIIFNLFFGFLNHILMNKYLFLIQEYKYIYIFTKYLYYLLWFIPVFCISILYNGYYTNELIKQYISEFFKENSSLKYICYEKYSLYLINKCYYQIIMIISIFGSFIISYIPYFGFILDCFLCSLLYSFYSWEYSWSSNKIPHNKRYEIFENNWSYYLGYGFYISILKIYFNYIELYWFVSVFFPLVSINTLNLYDKIIILKIKGIQFPLFKSPIIFTNYLVNLLNKNLEKYLKNINSDKK